MSTKTKLPSKFYTQTEGSDPVLLSKEEFFRKIKKETGATPAEAEGWFKGFLEIAASEGEFALDIPDGMEKDDIARYKAQYAALNKAYKAHLDIGADLEDAKAKREKEAATRGQQIIVGAEKGRATAGAIASHMVKDVATAMKGKFVFDGMEMKLVKGAKPTEKDFSEVMGCLLSLKGAATNAADATGFYLVDAIRLSKEAGFDGDSLIEQIAVTAGVEKFTAMSAQRIGEFWPPAKRLPGVNMSVHAEIANYAGGVKDVKALEAVIEKVKTGIVDEITTPEGKKIKTEKKNYGTKQVRAMMQEISGKTPPPKPPKSKGGEAPVEISFLYITTDEKGEEAIYVSNALSMVACADPATTVIDLTSLTQLGSKGELAYKLEDAPEAWFPTAEVTTPKTDKKKPKAEEPKSEEPKPTMDAELVGATTVSANSFLPE